MKLQAKTTIDSKTNKIFLALNALAGSETETFKTLTSATDEEIVTLSEGDNKDLDYCSDALQYQNLLAQHLTAGGYYPHGVGRWKYICHHNENDLVTLAIINDAGSTLIITANVWHLQSLEDASAGVIDAYVYFHGSRGAFVQNYNNLDYNNLDLIEQLKNSCRLLKYETECEAMHPWETLSDAMRRVLRDNKKMPQWATDVLVLTAQRCPHSECLSAALACMADALGGYGYRDNDDKASIAMSMVLILSAQASVLMRCDN